MKDYEKNVSLIFDEMKIKSGLMFCKTTGKMVGFTDMGPVNDTLNEFHRRFDRRITERNSELNLAQYVIVFMARGIFSSLCYYFGHFASEGFKNDQIYSCAWNAIMILESIGLKVRAIVSDGATANRKFYNLHKMEDSSNISEGVVYWTLNHCAPERKIFFICDVPRLLKTTRNNLESSHWNKKSRNLMVI
ncbi:uncharacterized protein LOC136080281 [Hydra vulgaris]|uniref:Uncharacterized protein LOC136080281 n=1 Tax=Hydra vulgaris TaxID=6087 RepID=A0ABM4BUX2_HYDVU